MSVLHQNNHSVDVRVYYVFSSLGQWQWQDLCLLKCLLKIFFTLSDTEFIRSYVMYKKFVVNGLV